MGHRYPESCEKRREASSPLARMRKRERGWSRFHGNLERRDSSVILKTIIRSAFNVCAFNALTCGRAHRRTWRAASQLLGAISSARNKYRYSWKLRFLRAGRYLQFCTASSHLRLLMCFPHLAAADSPTADSR